jgi:hypothetical protein
MPKVLLKSSVMFLALSALLGGCERYDLDRQMETLCKRDAGVKVYETIRLTRELFDAGGSPFPPKVRSMVRSVSDESGSVEEELLASAYRRTWEVTFLKKGDPVKGEGQLMRYLEKVIRLSDGKLLGEAVSYGRSGGDFIAYAHFTSNHCPIDQRSNAALRAVFIKADN